MTAPLTATAQVSNPQRIHLKEVTQEETNAAAAQAKSDALKIVFGPSVGNPGLKRL